MNIPDNINIKDYYYDLPENRIAKYPLKQRDSSKLLYYRNGDIDSCKFSDLPALLNNGHHLIFNDTKVIMARLQFRKETGAEIEIFLLEPYSPGDYQHAFNERKKTVWKCLVGNAKKWKSGSLIKNIILKDTEFVLKAYAIDSKDAYRLILFEWNNSNISFSDIINFAGRTPIPPYLNREAETIDKERYQTIYSNYEGSVAAPTAGLHFTTELMKRISEADIKYSKLTLHVGAGTFIPVKGENALKHDMHIEHFYFPFSTIIELINSGRQIISVGTTSVRAIETLYWLGVKLYQYPESNDPCFLKQFEWAELDNKLTRKQSFEAILKYMERENLNHLKASTKIMIIPGYKFMMTDGMITNFHQPYSTLLLLVAAFTGNDWKKIYSYALNNEYRFLSYGDSSLLIP